MCVFACFFFSNFFFIFFNLCMYHRHPLHPLSNPIIIHTHIHTYLIVSKHQLTSKLLCTNHLTHTFTLAHTHIFTLTHSHSLAHTPSHSQIHTHSLTSLSLSSLTLLSANTSSPASCCALTTSLMAPLLRVSERSEWVRESECKSECKRVSDGVNEWEIEGMREWVHDREREWGSEWQREREVTEDKIITLTTSLMAPLLCICVCVCVCVIRTLTEVIVSVCMYLMYLLLSLCLCLMSTVCLFLYLSSSLLLLLVSHS